MNFGLMAVILLISSHSHKTKVYSLVL